MILEDLTNYSILIYHAYKITQLEYQKKQIDATSLRTHIYLKIHRNHINSEEQIKPMNWINITARSEQMDTQGTKLFHSFGETENPNGQMGKIIVVVVITYLPLSSVGQRVHTISLFCQLLRKQSHSQSKITHRQHLLIIPADIQPEYMY